MLDLIFSVNTLWWLILVLYIPACFGLIIIVLLQKGKGQGLAGAFGMGGGMDTIFGPRSSKSLPQKITYASAGIFMALALVMSILSGKVGREVAPDLVAETPAATMEGLFSGEGEAVQEGEAVVEVKHRQLRRWKPSRRKPLRFLRPRPRRQRLLKPLRFLCARGSKRLWKRFRSLALAPAPAEVPWPRRMRLAGAGVSTE